MAFIAIYQRQAAGKRDFFSKLSLISGPEVLLIYHNGKIFMEPIRNPDKEMGETVYI